MTVMANTRRIKPGAAAASARTVHTIKVTLAGSRPPIWRRLQVPSATTLRALHDVIQAAFGFDDYHMSVFDTPSGRYGLPDADLEISNAAAKRLCRVALSKRDRLCLPSISATTVYTPSSPKLSLLPNRASLTPVPTPATVPAHPKTARHRGYYHLV